MDSILHEKSTKMKQLFTNPLKLYSVPRSPKVSNSKLLETIASAPDPFVTAQEIADRTKYTKDGARRRLHELEDEGWLRSRSVGARAKVWWITTEGRDQLR